MRYLLAVFLCLFFTTTLWASAQISYESIHYDFGEIKQGEKVEYVFRFRNIGDQVLEVGNVRSSCGCTAALLSATRIAGGDFGEVRATFDSTHFKGRIQKTITIDTNDPQHKQLVFTLVGNIKQEMLLNPERVRWNRVARETPLQRTVKVINRSQKLVRIKGVKTTNPGIKAELSQRELAAGAEAEVSVSLEVPADRSRLSGYVMLDTDYAPNHQLRLSVSARLAN